MTFFAIDFFVVPTLTFRLLFGFLVLRHHRRELVHVNVTDHPTAAWAAHQLVDSFPEETAPRYLLRDRDAIYGDAFVRRVKRPEDDRDPHRPSGAMAESVRRARHRLDSTRMPRSHHRDQRTPPPTSAAQLPRVQCHPPASIPPQRQPPSARSANPSGRAHCGDPAGRRTSSPVSARRLSRGSQQLPATIVKRWQPSCFPSSPAVLIVRPCAPRPPRRASSAHTLTPYSRQAPPRDL
jgi:hypothetical protein